MDAKIYRFARIWRSIFGAEFWRHAFGSAAAVGAVTIAAWLTYLPPSEALKPFAVAGYTVLAGVLLSIAWSAVAAIFKTFSALNPLLLSVTDDIHPPGFKSDDKARGYAATLIVRNRSVSHLIGCIAYVMNAPSIQGFPEQRLLEVFDIPPKSGKHIHFAYWWQRDSFDTDDKTIRLPFGSGGVFYNPNLYDLGPNAVVSLRVDVRDSQGENIKCRVWIDAGTRSLKAEAS